MDASQSVGVATQGLCQWLPRPIAEQGSAEYNALTFQKTNNHPAKYCEGRPKSHEPKSGKTKDKVRTKNGVRDSGEAVHGAEFLNGWEELREIKPTPPNVTYSSKKVLNLGGREVQLLFLGRGHTNGDTFVYLPKEKIVCTGDMMESQLAYMGNAQFDEWVATLEALKKLDFETDLPGHGVPFKGKGLITAYQGYLTDLMKQVAALRKQGATPEEAAQRVDLTSYKMDFPQIQGRGADIRGVRRLYQWMDEKTKK